MGNPLVRLIARACTYWFRRSAAMSNQVPKISLCGNRKSVGVVSTVSERGTVVQAGQSSARPPLTK